MYRELTGRAFIVILIGMMQAFRQTGMGQGLSTLFGGSVFKELTRQVIIVIESTSMIALLPAYMKIDRCVCIFSWSGSCEGQRYSAGNGSVAQYKSSSCLFCCDFGVHCDCSQGSTTYCQYEEASNASCCGQPAVCMLTPCGRYVEHHDGFSGRGVAHKFSSSTVTLCTTESCTFMLTPCVRQPIKFITIQPVWHWPVFSDRTVVTTAVLSMSKVCNFNSTSHMKMLKYGVLVGNTGHFDNEFNFAGSGSLGHESGQHQASIDRFVSRWLQCDHHLRPTRTRSTSSRRS